VDTEVAQLAARQHGVVSRAQLLAAGLSSDAIVRRTAAGRLHRVHAGVYAVGHRLLMPHARYLAAVLACGDHAVLSHRSAATLWGLQPAGSGQIDVTIPPGGSRKRRGLAIHVTRALDDVDVTDLEGIPCTSLARTLVDLAAVVNLRSLHRALEQALILRIFDHAPLEAALACANGRRGTGTLRRLLAELADEPPLVRSELERRFLEVVRLARLPPPIVNGFVAGYQVDFHWPAAHLVVETDGRAFHDHALAFERDRQRDLDLALAGWHVVRTGWRQVVEEPHRLIAMLSMRLGG
jgi:very-short-patch-repair endonuclease